MDPPSNIGWFCFHETIVSHICTKLTFTLFAFTLIARKIAILLTKVTINKPVFGSCQALPSETFDCFTEKCSNCYSLGLNPIFKF